MTLPFFLSEDPALRQCHVARRNAIIQSYSAAVSSPETTLR